MARAARLLVLLALGACTTLPPQPVAPSPCTLGEASYACQIERYQNVDA